MSQPLNEALRKEAPDVITWDGCKLDAFNFLKTVLCSHNVLWLPRGNDTFIVHTDASSGVIGREEWRKEATGLF